MQTRRKRQADGLAPLDAVGAIADTLPKRRQKQQQRPRPATPSVDAASQNLWPLSPLFPGPAMELVRSKLPSPTLAALRLVCRAARDDFVDSRCTQVRPLLWASAPVAALASAAPRLRSLASLAPAPFSDAADTGASAAGCEALTDVLQRLPGNGAALRELSVGGINLYGRLYDRAPDAALSRVLASFAAAVGRLSGLQSLEVAAHGVWDGFELFEAAGALPALTRLTIAFCSLWPVRPAWWRPPPTPPQHLLRRLEALALGGEIGASWLRMLLEPEVAAEMTRLRDLSLLALGSCEGDNALPPAPWRPQWLPQLTRLAVANEHEYDLTMTRVCCALASAPGALPALRALAVINHQHSSSQPPGQLRDLLNACDAAALESLTLSGSDAIRGIAAELPSLRALAYQGCDAPFALSPRDFEGVALAPLTRLELTVGWLLGDGTEFTPLFASDSLRGLRELTLLALDAAGAQHGGRALRCLRGLSALAALTRLCVQTHFKAQALEKAAAQGVGDVWAPALVELRLHLLAPRADVLHALLLLPALRRLERLELALEVGLNKRARTVAVTREELDGFSSACCKALPRLTALEFTHF